MADIVGKLAGLVAAGLVAERDIEISKLQAKIKELEQKIKLRLANTDTQKIHDGILKQSMEGGLKTVELVVKIKELEEGAFVANEESQIRNDKIKQLKGEKGRLEEDINAAATILHNVPRIPFVLGTCAKSKEIDKQIEAAWNILDHSHCYDQAPEGE